MKFFVAFLLAVGTAATHAMAGSAATRITLSIVHVPLREAEPGETRVGKLILRDGAVLKSSNPAFGGISGLAVSRDGTRFLAITDEGSWIAGSIAYDGSGKINAIEAAIAPMLGEDGKPLDGKTMADAESLSIISGETDDGIVAVGFERTPRIWRYDLGTHGYKAKPHEIPAPAELQDAPSNGGLEALRMAGGQLILLTEDLMDIDGNSVGWVLPQSGGEGARFTLRREFPYAPTDIAALPDGDLLVLERSYTPLGGPGMQLRRIVRGDLREGASVDAETLARLGAGYSIDNMEGLAVRPGENGETLIYLISDDNFNPLQRTILLIFELAD